jgi:hypothetical protein
MEVELLTSTVSITVSPVLLVTVTDGVLLLPVAEAKGPSGVV